MYVEKYNKVFAKLFDEMFDKPKITINCEICGKLCQVYPHEETVCSKCPGYHVSPRTPEEE